MDATPFPNLSRDLFGSILGLVYMEKLARGRFVRIKIVFPDTRNLNYEVTARFESGALS